MVVHNAGVTRDKTLARMKPEQWDQASTSTSAPSSRITEALSRRPAPRRRARRSACRRSRASPATSARPTTRRPRRASSASCARWRRQLAARGITVNAIAPGLHRDAADGGDPGRHPRGRPAAVGARPGRPARGRRRRRSRSSRAPARRASPGRSARLRRRAHRRLSELLQRATRVDMQVRKTSTWRRTTGAARAARA